MRQLLATIERWREEGKRVALATLIRVYGSAPQPLGAKMAVSSAGEMIGSVSGGCVEGAILEEALAVLQTGRPRRLTFGIPDEQAWEVGLACGGTIEVFVEPLVGPEEPDEALYEALREALEREEPVARAMVIAGPGLGRRMLIWPDGRTLGALASPSLEAQVLRHARALLAAQRPERATFSVDDETVELFLDVHPPPPKLVIVGAVQIAIPLVTFAKALGFRTFVVDARAAFATHERFPHADALIVKWPTEALAEIGLDEATYVVVLSHDEKLDNPALKMALESPARYVGALGSRKTHARRVEALRQMGVSEEAIARIHAPIGLDLGAQGPEEIAVAIIAEIVAVRRGRRERQGRGDEVMGG
ncbi:MAG: XdhC/CoxI family protein [Chloroflexi bacterium]|nr:MAG: XdhC/CoxI family protein [Chloroflexota bacterium]